MLHGVEDAEQVDFHHAARFLGCDLRQAYEAVHDAGIVDGDVEPAEFFDGQLHKILRELFIGDVAGKGRRLGVEGCGEIGQSGLVEVGKNQPRAFGGKGLGRAAAETASRAGDEDGRSVETPICPPSASALLVDQIHRQRGKQLDGLSVSLGLLGIGGIAVQRAAIDALADRRQPKE